MESDGSRPSIAGATGESRLERARSDDGDVAESPGRDAEDFVEPGVAITAAERNGFHDGQAWRQGVAEAG